MATLYIAEFSSTMDGMLAKLPPVAEQIVAITGKSVQSAAFNAATRFIRVHADAACSILMSANPVVVVVKMRLAAGQTEYFGVTAGNKLAVISNI